MKRTFVTLGVVGLGLLSVTAPALAASERVIVCHNEGNSWAPLEFNINGLAGHDQHPLDIIPPTSKSPGKNWTDAGKLLYVAECAPLPPGETMPEADLPVEELPADPPVEEPAAEEEPAGAVEVPEVEAPAVTPVVEQPAAVPAAVAPSAALPAAGAPSSNAPAAAPAPQVAAVGGTAPAASSLGTNQGYNAQTAVGGTDSAPSMLAGLSALAAAGAAVALRRRSRPFTPAG